MTLLKELDLKKKNIDLRTWILKELSAFESKFGMTTREFKEKWNSQEIPEPEDHQLLEEFLEWEVLADILQKVEKELNDIEKRIKES